MTTPADPPSDPVPDRTAEPAASPSPARTLYLNEPGSDPAAPKRGRLRTWLFRGLIALGVAVPLGLLLLPEVIAQPPWGARILSAVLPKLNGRLEVGQLSCGWFSPLAVHDVRIFDAKDARVIRIGSIVFDKPLWRIALDSTQIGIVRIVHPEVEVVVVDGKHNFEDLFLPADPEEPQPPEAEKPKKPVAWGLAIENGTTDVTIKKPNEPAVTYRAERIRTRIVPTAEGTIPFELGGRLRDEGYELDVQGRYEPKTGDLDLPVCKLRSPGKPWGVDLTGRLGGAEPLPLKLSGDVGYDLSYLAEILRPSLGQDLLLTGQGRSTLTAAGNVRPFMPADGSAVDQEKAFEHVDAAVKVPVEAVRVQGISARDLQLAFRLTEGVLAFRMDTPELNRGNVTVEGQYEIFGNRRLVLAPGRVVQGVRLTPEVCAGGLRMIAPIMADSAKIDGGFSLELAECDIPLNLAHLSRVRGVLEVHDVELGSNNLTRGLAELLGLPTEIRLISDNRIAFEMADQAVRHDGLEFTIANLKLRSRGEVRFDEKIALEFQLIVPENFGGNQALLKRFAGKSLVLPVGGTLRKPEINLSNSLRGNLTSLVKLLDDPGGGGGLLSDEGSVQALEGLLLGTDAAPGAIDWVSEMIRKRRAAKAPAPPTPDGQVAPPAADPPKSKVGDRLRRLFGGRTGTAPPAAESETPPQSNPVPPPRTPPGPPPRNPPPPPVPGPPEGREF